ncbi:MAG TPA: hypothetical protein DCQ14_02380, partial [Firmicutes bacterium]|nr:hypothetical protein [Bacillota bacterium]
PVDYEALNEAGLAMGPGLIVADEQTCIVDMVKYYLTFLARESCGKCTPCRDGIRHMLKILHKITDGRGKDDDLALLELLAGVQKKAALCALGQGAAGPLLSSLEHFWDEFAAHIEKGHCPAGVCRGLSLVGAE